MTLSMEILVAGLTPAWQQIAVLETFKIGSVNRAKEVHWVASGKVLNVAFALQSLGVESRTLALAGGLNGKAMKEQCEAKGLKVRWVESAASSRVCTTLLDLSKKISTEIVENTPAISFQEQASFLAAFGDEAQTAKLTVVTGSLPEGVPSDFYKRLVRVKEGRIILDARGPELLEALSEKPFLIKPNREELAATVGQNLSQDAALKSAMQEMNQRGAQWVLVTEGKKNVWLSGEGKLFRVHPPIVPIINPIGSGDCVAAGVAASLLQGKEPQEALRLGVAAGAANVSSLLPARLDSKYVQGLLSKITVEAVS
jgi:tagatose 6-phosphate kinase